MIMYYKKRSVMKDPNQQTYELITMPSPKQSLDFRAVSNRADIMHIQKQR